MIVEPDHMRYVSDLFKCYIVFETVITLSIDYFSIDSAIITFVNLTHYWEFLSTLVTSDVYQEGSL